MKNVIAEKVMHKGMDRVTLRFPYDAELIKIVKGLPDARWSQQMGCWHIEDSSDIISTLLKVFYGKAYIDYSALKPNLAEKIRLKREEEQRKNDKKLKGIGDADLLPLSEKGKTDIEKYRRWMESHRYPETTIRTYIVRAKLLAFCNIDSFL